MKKLILILLCLAASVYANAAEKLKIAVSIAPLYNITKAITGAEAELTLMVPAGASPHTFSPKPSQLKSLADADLFIQAGAGLEFWADKMVKASENKKLKVIRITSGIELLQEENGHEDNHNHDTGNPHVWLDPVIVKIFSADILNSVSSLKPEGKEYFIKNYKKFSSELDTLDKYIYTEIKKFRIKELISFHPAWAYFEKRYGLKEIAVIEEVPGRNPSPGELQNIVNQIKKYKIKTIFAEPQLSRKAADVIAEEAGITVLILDPIGNITESYFDFIKRNLNIMKEAMK